MLSVVGPAAHLAAFGVSPVIVDNPKVGQGMADNPMNPVFIPSPEPVEVSLVQAVGITKFGSYIEGGCALSVSISLTRSFFDNVLKLLEKTRLPTQSISSFLKYLDLRLNVTTKGVIIQKANGPLSSGHLKLKNTNPDDNPLVTFNYYQDPEDLSKCVVEGLSTIIKVIDSKGYSKYKYHGVSGRGLLNLILALPTNLRPRHIASTFDLQQYCIDIVMTIYHYHGGCQVVKVVDNSYKVLGIDTLRVIDESTFSNLHGLIPRLPS